MPRDEVGGTELLALLPNGMSRGDGKQIRLPLSFEPVAQVFAAVDAVAHDPLRRDSSSKGTCEHLLGQLRLACKGATRGDAGFLTAGGVVEPLLRHIQLAVDEGTAGLTGIG